jgi:hypothetical protein
MDQMLVAVILLSIYFVGFISGFGARAIISQNRRHKAREARRAAQVDASSANRAASATPSEIDSPAAIIESLRDEI